MSTQHPDDLLPALALDAVDDIERRRLMDHIDDCEQCQTDLDGLRETAAALSSDEEPVSAELRASVLAAIDDGQPAPPRRDPWRSKPKVLAVAAAIVAVLAVGAIAITRLYTGPDQTGHPGDTMSQVLAAPDMRKATGTLGDGGSVAAMYSPSMRATVVTVDKLPPVEQDMGYQVWITVDGQMKSAGMVTPHKANSVMMTDMGRPVDVGLSVEPMAGSTQPTSPMVVSFPVT